MEYVKFKNFHLSKYQHDILSIFVYINYYLVLQLNRQSINGTISQAYLRSWNTFVRLVYTKNSVCIIL